MRGSQPRRCRKRRRQRRRRARRGIAAPARPGRRALPRIPLDEPSPLQAQQGLLDMITGSGAIGGWGLGAYGPDRDDPRLVLLVVKTRETSTAGLIAGGMVDAVHDRLGGDLSPPRSFTDDARRGVRS